METLELIPIAEFVPNEELIKATQEYFDTFRFEETIRQLKELGYTREQIEKIFENIEM